MKKTLLVILCFSMLFVCSCAKENESDPGYLNDVFRSVNSVFKVDCDGIVFSLQNGSSVFSFPPVLDGLTVCGDKVTYKDVETEIPETAFYVSTVLKNAVLDFSGSGKDFNVSGEGAEYIGSDYEIYIDNAVSPTKMTVVYDGTEKEYKILSIAVQ